MATFAVVALLAVAGPAVALVDDAECSASCKHRVIVKEKRRVVAPHRAWFTRVASCESNGRWGIATGNGFYGGLQFTLASWWAVGGRGYPHRASKTEQMYRGVRLLRAQGPGAWPICSRVA